MKRILTFLSLIILASELGAFHIVGGEIEFITIAPGQYRINLIQYRDEAQNQNNVIDPTVTVSIFSNKLDDDGNFRSEPETTHILTLVSQNDVFYTNVACQLDELQTSRVLYSAEINLSPQKFADEEGYYIVWERCCRNTAVTNIVNPSSAGMKYVVEIPPLWKDGQAFVNSSPVLLRPLSDYACVDQLFYTSFTGVDRDGDSLAYRMAAPLNSSAQTPVPIPQPKPHSSVTWEAGFGIANTIPGSPALGISSSGLLTVNPSRRGLYVFSVIVEEWRNGEQIGLVQRDFQMLVIDGCTPPEPPHLVANFDEEDTLGYTVAESKCFDLVVTNLNPGETIFMRAEPENFEGDLSEIFTINNVLVGADEDSLLIEICIPDCPPVRDKPFTINFIAGDDSCPLPQLDSLSLTFEVESPPNEFPVTNNFQAQYEVMEDDVLTIDITATDADMDSMVLNLVIPGVADPAARGFTIDTVLSELGNLEARLTWDTDCREFDFMDVQNFQVGVAVEDLDSCAVENPEIKWFDLRVLIPENTGPEVTITDDDVLTLREDEPLNFDAIAVDADMDTVILSLITPGFEAQNLGISFNDTLGVGEAESPFGWSVDCATIVAAGINQFQLLFTAEDLDKCQVVNQDTLPVLVEVIIEDNRAPVLTDYGTIAVEVNSEVELDIIASDLDQTDSVTIEFFNPSRLPQSETLFFESKTGQGEVSSLFTWTPECSLLDFGVGSTFYDIVFLAYDNGCPAQLLDTMKVTFEIFEDKEAFAEFRPPNVFTPNGDNFNDTFTLTNLPDQTMNLPNDNCDNFFESISIVNRSGQEVFKSDSREFLWDGSGTPSGVYYYSIKYSKREYNGYIQLLK